MLEMVPGEDLKHWLMDRGRAHFIEGSSNRNVITESILAKAADMLIEDRMDCEGVTKPGLSEFLDLLRAVEEICLSEKLEAVDILLELRRYTLRKSASLD